MDCNGCTACCTYLDVPWMDSPVGSPCRECQVGKGCKIFSSMPDKCRSYNCAYRQMEKASEEMRPDKCGVIFEKIDDQLMFGLMFAEKVSAKIVGQIKAFNREGMSVVIDVMSEKKLFKFPSEFDDNAMFLKARLDRHMEKKYGSS